MANKHISLRFWNGDPVKLPGHHDRKIAEKIRANIASLNRSRHLDELPNEPPNRCGKAVTSH
jgi:hypothetical protein